MGKLQNVRRIILEDFDEDIRPTIEKLAIILNSHMEDVNNLANHNINFDNLYREIVKIKVTVDANGVPTKNTQFSTTYLPSAHGGSVLAVSNLTTPSALLTGTPFVSFYPVKNNLFKITQVTGITANQVYEITLEVVGK